MNPNTSLAKKTSAELVRRLTPQAITKRLSEQHISLPARSVVIARVTGTPIRRATEQQLELMWNEIIGLMAIGKKEEEMADFVADLQNLNDWVFREYPGLTCEEVILAYTKAAKGELKLDAVIPSLGPRYFGAILSAYRKAVDNDIEVNRVFAQQLLLRAAEEQANAEQIETTMQAYLQTAIDTVKAGKFFKDMGNALFQYLFESGRINPTPAQAYQYMELAYWQISQVKYDAENAHSKTGAAKLETLIAIKPNVGEWIKSQAKTLFLNDYLKTLIDVPTP